MVRLVFTSTHSTARWPRSVFSRNCRRAVWQPCYPLMLDRLLRRRASTQIRCALSVTLIDQTAGCCFPMSPVTQWMGKNGVALENARCPEASENIEPPKALAEFSARVPNIDVSVGKGGRKQGQLFDFL